MTSSDPSVVPAVKDLRIIALPAGWYDASKGWRNKLC
jgi:hypothetical protein